MEIDNTQKSGKESVNSMENSELIKVRAIISCESCSYKKKFRNQFLRKEIDLIIVSLKCFDWLTCSKCGDLLKLDLEFSV